MTEKEMVEEMQKVMEYCCNVYDDKGNHIRNKCNSFDCEYYDKTNGVCCSYSLKEAKALYKQGYRKIPEGSVVLSKEEFDRLKRIELEKDRLYEIKLDLENQLIQSGLTEYIGADEIEKQARKETAKEILKEIKERFVATYLLPTGLDLPAKKVKYAKITEDDLNEIAKQFGVEE